MYMFESLLNHCFNSAILLCVSQSIVLVMMGMQLLQFLEVH